MGADNVRRISLTVVTWLTVVGVAALWIIGSESLTWTDGAIFLTSVIIGAVLTNLAILVTTIIWE